MDEQNPITFIYELDPYSLEIYRMCKYELRTSRLSQVIVRQTNRHVRLLFIKTVINYFHILTHNFDLAFRLIIIVFSCSLTTCFTRIWMNKWNRQTNMTEIIYHGASRVVKNITELINITETLYTVRQKNCTVLFLQ